MNTPARFFTVCVAGCLCSTLLYSLIPDPVVAEDKPPRHRHSLITRPEVAAGEVNTTETTRAPKILDKFKPLSLLAPTTSASDSTTLPQPPTSQSTLRIATTDSPTADSQVNSSGSAPLLSRSDETKRLAKPHNPKPSKPTVVALPSPPPIPAPVVTAPSPPPAPPAPTPVIMPPPPPSPPPAPSFGSASLTWNPNTDTDLAGYKVHVGTSSGMYTFAGPFDSQGATSYTVGNLPKGQTYYFAISAYDRSGNESLLSAEVSKSIVN